MEPIGGTKDTIAKTRGRLAWFEKRESELADELRVTPSVGFHKARFWELSRALDRLRRLIEDEREYLKWLMDAEKDLVEFEAKITSGERRALNEFRARHIRLEEERKQREREAIKRRARFKLILGGRSV